MNDFHYAQSLLNTIYGIEMDDDDFEEIAVLAYRLIGNKNMRIHRYTTCVDKCEDGLELPCDIQGSLIEAVTAGFDDWDYSNNYTRDGNMYSAVVEQYIESRKAFRNPLYAPGKFIKYELVGNKLYFDRPHGRVNILYRTEELDDNGLPYISDSEAMAIATYVAYVTKFKEGLATNNNNAVLMAAALQQQWKLQCDLARVDQYITQNEWDEILDSRSRGLRKQYGKSYKIYR